MKKKDSMLNVRLDSKTNQQLSDYSEMQQTSKSSIVNEALAMYFNQEQMKQNPYLLGKDLFGADASGETDKSITYKSKLKEKIRAKHTH